MRRRDFTKLALTGTVASVAAPAVARAQTTFNWKMTSFYGPNAYFYSVGPGSAKDLNGAAVAIEAREAASSSYGLIGDVVPENNSLNLLGLSSFTVLVAKGGVILAAAVLDAWRERLAGR